MKNKSVYFNKLYHLPQVDKRLMALEKTKLTTHPNPTGYYPKTYQKIDIENLLNRLFNPKSCYKLFVLYNLHKNHR